MQMNTGRKGGEGIILENTFFKQGKNDRNIFDVTTPL
jgi:hypothetical protein